VDTLNILKYLSHPCTVCSRKLLLQSYNRPIRSQLDYGAPMYSRANKSSLKLLDSIQSSALRLALGALRTSPTLSLCAEAGVPPLGYRFLSLTANFLACTSQYPNLPPSFPMLSFHKILSFFHSNPTYIDISNLSLHSLFFIHPPLVNSSPRHSTRSY